MVTNDNDSFVSDTFDEWLRARTVEDPPADLRDRCRATIAQTLVEPPLRRNAERARFLTPRNLTWIVGVAASLAAVMFLWICVSSPRSVLAQSVETIVDSIGALEKAPAVHAVTKINESRAPERIGISEVWAVRGLATATTIKVNGKVTWKILDDGKTHSEWSSEKNEVVSQPSLIADERGPRGAWLHLFDLEILTRHDQWAKDAGLAAKIEDITRENKKLRRVSIGPGARVFSGLTSGVVIDIDPANSRPVRILLTIDYGSYQRTDEHMLEYPDPNRVDKALFALDLPKDVRRVRLDPKSDVKHPAEVQAVVGQLKQIGLAMHIFLDVREDGRLPTAWISDLMPYLGDSHVMFVAADDKSEDRDKPTYTSFRFFHTGEKYSAFQHPEKTVVAEYRHSSGAIIRLFANGQTEVETP
ncbi:MAG: anti-sigma factor [Planctomycetes bacterium]|nr:anti-sigma factor [Planctomycetota bacterium]